MWQTSRGKFDRFPRTTAGYTLRTVDGYGLRCPWPTRPALTPHPVSVRRLACLLRASFGPRLTTTPLRFAILHLHQVGSGTFTLKLSNMLGTPGAAPLEQVQRRPANCRPAGSVQARHHRSRSGGGRQVVGIEMLRQQPDRPVFLPQLACILRTDWPHFHPVRRKKPTLHYPFQAG